jgi:hypothetical protein
MWSEDNLKNYPYLLLNPVSGPDGSMQISGPAGYTKPPAVPPALAGLLQISEQDMKDVLGNQEQGDKIVSNISGRAVEMVQQRLDMQTYIYMSNQGKAIRRCGEIWLGMAKEMYVEDGRKMKAISNQSKIQTVQLMKPMINESGEMEYENDLSKADFDVAVDVGPSSSSKRAATVRALTGIIAITEDPQIKNVLLSMAMMNMEGEGLTDINDYFRSQLVQMGVVKPTEEEQAQLQAMMENKPQDMNAMYLQAEAEKAIAQAEQARAKTVETVASAELKRAQTMETLSNMDMDSQDHALNMMKEMVTPQQLAPSQ